MGADDELVEVVAEDGTVERIVTRAEMRAGVLRHRSTYVVVRRTSGSLVVHRRADWKDIYPGIWDLAFGGVVDAGEAWLTAAQRELAEEAGITGVAMESLGKARYEEADGRVIARVFLAVTDAPLTCPDGEVAEVTEVDDLPEWLHNHEVCPDSLQILAKTGLGHPAIGWPTSEIPLDS